MANHLIGMFNIFEENRAKKQAEKMKKMFNDAKNSSESYCRYIDELERNFDAFPKLVRAKIAEVRRKLWPEEQVAQNPWELEVINKNTFENLKSGNNFEKFAKSFDNILNQQTSTKA